MFANLVYSQKLLVAKILWHMVYCVRPRVLLLLGTLPVCISWMESLLVFVHHFLFSTCASCFATSMRGTHGNSSCSRNSGCHHWSSMTSPWWAKVACCNGKSPIRPGSRLGSFSVKSWCDLSVAESGGYRYRAICWDFTAVDVHAGLSSALCT